MKVVPLEATDSPEPPEERAKRRIGFLEGQVTVPDDFDTFMQDEIIAMFEGKYKGVINPEYEHLEPKRLKPGEFGYKGDG